MKRGAWIGILLAGVVPLAAVHADQKSDNSAVLKHQAAGLFRDGEYSDAIALYRQLAEADPQNLNAQKDLMWALWNAGQFEDAGQIADRVLAVSPSDVEAKTISDRAFLTANREKILKLRAQAAACIRAGDYETAVAIYHELTTLDAYNYRLLKDAMWANVRAHHMDEALALAKRVLALRSNDADAIDIIDHDPGINEDPALFAKLPIGAQIRIAALRAQAGHLQEALQILTRIAAAHPTNTDVLRYLTSTYHRAGLYPDGLRTAQQWTALAPHDSQAWFWLAVLQMDMGKIADGEASYERSLAINPNQPRAELAIGRFYLSQREFALALQHLEKARRADPKLSDVYPLLAKGYYWTQRFETSADLWTKSIQLFPARTEYLFNEAEALYYAGHRPEALDKMRAIIKTNPQSPAFLFLVDDALAHKDTDGAVRLLEDHLQVLHPTDEPLVLKLCDLYNERQQWDAMSTLTDRFLAIRPNSEGALSMKGNALYAKKDYKASAAMNQRILDINPNDVDALQTLAACERAMGHHGAVRAALRRLRQVDPTDPTYLLLEAQARYDDGFITDSRQSIEKWERVNSTSTVLPILLYHALTPFKDDPVLAYPYHLTIASFQNQLEGLTAAGYTTVTTGQVGQWLRHQGTLPEHPVLISFDDGRYDSVLYGDPVLEKTKMHASMFAALVNAEGSHPPGFLSWSGLQKAQRTGRWEIESHGDLGHLHVVIDADGDDGLFLVNRAWKPEEKRLETVDEWRVRVDSDYASSHDKIQANIGVAPEGYAFPEGIYGQQGVVNTAEALDTNMDAVEKSFSTAYTQDHFGMNLQSRDPYHLKRLEPSNDWDSAKLLQHLHDSDPRVEMLCQLLDWAAAEGRRKDAENYLNQLKTYQISDGLRLSKEAEIALASGDVTRGKELTDQALALGDFPDLRRGLADARLQDGWSYDGSVTYEEDSSHRRSLLFENALRTARYGPWRFGARQQWGWFRDNGAGTIFDDGLGLEAQYWLGLYHHFTAVVMGQALSSPASKTFTATGSWEAQWRHRVTTELDGGQRFVPTASAMAHGIDDRFVEGRARWTINDWWRAETDNHYSSLTDGNNLLGTVDELSRLVWSPLNLRLVYQFTYENASEVRPEYYSPQDLVMNALGPEFWVRVSTHMKWWLRYLPGYATEDGIGGQWDHTLDTHLEMDWDSDSLEPDFTYYQTPSYHERIYRLEYVHRF